MVAEHLVLIMNYGEHHPQERAQCLIGYSHITKKTKRVMAFYFSNQAGNNVVTQSSHGSLTHISKTKSCHA